MVRSLSEQWRIMLSGQTHRQLLQQWGHTLIDEVVSIYILTNPKDLSD